MLVKIPTTVKNIAADLLTKHPELTRHMAKAIDLTMSERLRFSHHNASGAPVYLVTSSDGASVYVVEAGACTCPARKLCYHRVARGLLVIRSANQTLVDFSEAIAAEEPPRPPDCIYQGCDLSAVEGSPYCQGCKDREEAIERGEKKRRELGLTPAEFYNKPAQKLTIRGSMDALGERLRSARLLLTAAKVP